MRSDSRDASSTDPGTWQLLGPSPSFLTPFSLPNRHWLSSAYTQFAVPYFIYDIYAMFLCHWHKHQVKGHGGDEGEARAPGSTWAVARGYLHKEFLMVLHHAVMVLVCFPLSVVSRAAGSQGPHVLLIPAQQKPGEPWVLVCRAGPGWKVPTEGLLSTGPAPHSKRVWGQPGRDGPCPAVVLQRCCCVSLRLSFLIYNIRHTILPAGCWRDTVRSCSQLWYIHVQTFRVKYLRK